MSLYAEIEKQLGSFCLKLRLEAENETLALLGASGCGKSVTLRCIAGLMRPDKGRIVADGVTLFDSEKGIDLPPQQRRVGFLLQNYGLFPHMTVLENIRAGARREKDRRERNACAEGIMERFGIGELRDRLPGSLSGGQQQRVALARILVSEPEILLLDEPFSALDSHLRFQLEQELRRTIAAFGKTVLLVSHDRQEVYRLSDRVALMEGGRLLDTGPKERIFSRPESLSGARLTGCQNLSPLQRVEGGWLASDWGLHFPSDAFPEGTEYLGIHAHAIVRAAETEGIACEVLQRLDEPRACLLLLRPRAAMEDKTLLWELPKGEELPEQETYIRLPSEALLPLGKP